MGLDRVIQPRLSKVKVRAPHWEFGVVSTGRLAAARGGDHVPDLPHQLHLAQWGVLVGVQRCRVQEGLARGRQPTGLSPPPPPLLNKPHGRS